MTEVDVQRRMEMRIEKQREEGWGGAQLTNPRRAAAAATPTTWANAICERISSDGSAAWPAPLVSDGLAAHD